MPASPSPGSAGRIGQFDQQGVRVPVSARVRSIPHAVDQPVRLLQILEPEPVGERVDPQDVVDTIAHLAKDSAGWSGDDAFKEMERFADNGILHVISL